jgi:hypothetical protein
MEASHAPHGGVSTSPALPGNSAHIHAGAVVAKAIGQRLVMMPEKCQSTVHSYDKYTDSGHFWKSVCMV